MGVTKTDSIFSCRIVAIEYTNVPAVVYSRHGVEEVRLDPQICQITQKKVHRAPLVRVFGPTLTGENACLSVHGVFPYFYVDWAESLSSLLDANVSFDLFAKRDPYRSHCCSIPTYPFKSFDSLLYALACSIDEALELAPTRAWLNQYNQKDKPGFVYSINIVYRRSIYGYVKEREPFLKVQLLDVRTVHEAAKFLLDGGFYGIKFQPFEVHLIGLQFLSDLNLRGIDISVPVLLDANCDTVCRCRKNAQNMYFVGMDYIYVEKDRLFTIAHSQRTRAANVICDIDKHTTKAMILNQYTTILQPDQQVDEDAIRQSLAHQIKCVQMLEDEKTLLPFPAARPQGNNQQLLLKFSARCSTNRPKWGDFQTEEPPRPEWIDPWPPDYDDPNAPPVGTSMETLWNEEDTRREHRSKPKALSMYEKRLNASFKRCVADLYIHKEQCQISSLSHISNHFRKVDHSYQMMEEVHYNMLSGQLRWNKYLPAARFGNESDVESILSGMVVNDEIVAGCTPPTIQSSIPDKFLSALPRYSNPDDIPVKKLGAEIRRLRKAISQLPMTSKLRPCGAKVKGLERCVSSGNNFDSLDPHRTLFFHRPAPQITCQSLAAQTKCQRVEEDASDQALTTSLDNHGRVLLQGEKDASKFRSARRVVTQSHAKALRETQASKAPHPEQPLAGSISDNQFRNKHKRNRPNFTPPTTCTVKADTRGVVLELPRIDTEKKALMDTIDKKYRSDRTSHEGSQELIEIKGSCIQNMEFSKRKRPGFIRLLSKIQSKLIDSDRSRESSTTVGQLMPFPQSGFSGAIPDAQQMDNEMHTGLDSEGDKLSVEVDNDVESSPFLAQTPPPKEQKPLDNDSGSGGRMSSGKSRQKYSTPMVDIPGRNSPSRKYVGQEALNFMLNLPDDAPQKGFHLGRLLAMECMTDLLFTKRFTQPIPLVLSRQATNEDLLDVSDPNRVMNESDNGKEHRSRKDAISHQDDNGDLSMLKMASLCRSQKNNPKTIRQAKRHIPSPQIDRILAVVFVCRFDVPDDVDSNLIIQRIQKSIPFLKRSTDGVNANKTVDFLKHRVSKAVEVGHIDVCGAVYIDEFESNWETIDSEVYTFQCAEYNYPFFRGRESFELANEVQKFRVPSEVDLICWVTRYLFRIFDPAIVAGFDTYTNSIGFILTDILHEIYSSRFLIQRAMALGFQNVSKHLGRLPPTANFRPNPSIMVDESLVSSPSAVKDNTIARASGNVTLPGRIVLNIWRHFREEVKTTKYTVHGLASDVLSITFPFYNRFTLARWWFAGITKEDSNQSTISEKEPWSDLLVKMRPLRTRCLHFLLRYVELSLKLLDSVDLLSRSEELARLFGTDFWSVMSRGSQHRVEAMVSRAAHALGYLCLTATKLQVQQQPATMCLPLVLEPESAFYWWPVVVVDFQSLYPSIIIGYNLCYSTCLGRIGNLWKDEKRNEEHTNRLNREKWKQLGVSRVRISPEILQELQCLLVNKNARNEENDEKLCITVMPDETIFVNRSIRRGILPALLEEVISTRMMIKESMKLLKGDKKGIKLLRRQNHRQFGLKMFANVTYGYTTASYTGRMPCSEIADSIVQIARRTLERSISYIEEHPQWNARVVYGDTDSMFISLEGRSLEEAFKIGREIVNDISSINPWPLELLLEKVYFPCCLQTKKRYVGWSYESPDSAPKLDSKGIEVVRRDQCPIVSSVLQQGLETLFTTRDISRVKAQLQDCWTKMILGEPQSSLIDSIFLRELKLGSYAYNHGKAAHTLPPQAVVSYHMLHDWRLFDSNNSSDIFEYKIRLPYVVVNGPPNSRLIDQVSPPDRVALASAPLCPLSPNVPSVGEKLSIQSISLQIDKYLYSLWSSQHFLQLNVEWYIKKQIIPVLQRMFCLLGTFIKVEDWFTNMQKPTKTAQCLHQQQPLTELTLYDQSFIEYFKGDHPPFFYKYEITNGNSKEFSKDRVKVPHAEIDHEIIDITEIDDLEFPLDVSPKNESAQIKTEARPNTPDSPKIVNKPRLPDSYIRSDYELSDFHQGEDEGLLLSSPEFAGLFEFFDHEKPEQTIGQQKAVQMSNPPKLSPTESREVRNLEKADREIRRPVSAKQLLASMPAQQSGETNHFTNKDPPIQALGNIPTLLHYLPSAMPATCKACGNAISYSKASNVKPMSDKQKMPPPMPMPAPKLKRRGLLKFGFEKEEPKRDESQAADERKLEVYDIKKLRPTDDLNHEKSIVSETFPSETMRKRAIDELRFLESRHQFPSQNIESVICPDCLTNPRLAIWKLMTRVNNSERRHSQLMHLCINCTGSIFAAESCHDAFHCKIYPKRIQSKQRLIDDIEDLSVMSQVV